MTEPESGSNGKFLGAFSVVPTEAITRAEINRAILRGPDELAIDFTLEDLRYTVILHRRSGSEFAGPYEIVKHRSGRTAGEVTCNLYRDGERLFLFGRFPLGEGVFVWWAFLEPVDRFADEQSNVAHRGMSSPDRPVDKPPRRRRYP